MADTKWTREIVPGEQYEISKTDRITIANFDSTTVTIANMDDESSATTWTQETLP